MIVEIGSHGMDTPYEYYYRTNEIKGNVKSFGLISAVVLDIKRMALGFNEVPEKDAIAEMNGYFSSQKESSKNGMTGIFNRNVDCFAVLRLAMTVLFYLGMTSFCLESPSP